jgi:hypothetical protein
MKPIALSLHQFANLMKPIAHSLHQTGNSSGHIASFSGAIASLPRRFAKFSWHLLRTSQYIL